MLQEHEDEKRSWFSLKNCLIGCVSIGIIGVIVVYCSFKYVMLHTAIPLKAGAALLENIDNLEIGEVSGSIAEGAAIDKVSYTHSDGKVSFAEGLSMKHSDLTKLAEGEEFIIHEMKAKRAHIYFDSSTSTQSSSTTTTTTGSGNTQTQSTNDLKHFEIKTIDIGSIVLEDRATGWKFDLDKFKLDEFVVTEDKVEIGPVVMSSNMLDINVSPAESMIIDEKVEDLKQEFSFTIKPAISEQIVKAMSFTGSYHIANNKFINLTATALNGGVNLQVVEADGRPAFTLTAENVSLSDYVKHAVLETITLRVTGKPHADKDKIEIELHNGSFKLGKCKFAFTPQKIIAAEDTDPAKIRFAAVTRQGTDTYVIEFGVGSDSPKLALKSTPEQTTEEALSKILFGVPKAQLNATQKQTVDSCCEWFQVRNTDE